MSLTLVLIMGVALLLLYSAVRNKNPVDVVKHALKSDSPVRPLAG